MKITNEKANLYVQILLERITKTKKKVTVRKQAFGTYTIIYRGREIISLRNAFMLHVVDDFDLIKGDVRRFHLTMEQADLLREMLSSFYEENKHIRQNKGGKFIANFNRNNSYCNYSS